MRAITACRTAQLGGHMDTCQACGYEKPSYNSCRNRHCPKCQSLVKERWIEHQKYDLLNVGYFHVVFTVPAELNQLIYQNQRTLYNLMFRTVAETMTELSADKKYLGAVIGFTSVLHTWGQNLMHHPHIHCIVPSGGLTKDGKWLNSRKKFFLPVKVLSRKFRGKFLATARFGEGEAMPSWEVYTCSSRCEQSRRCFNRAFYGGVVRYFPHSKPHSFRGFVLSELSQSWVRYALHLFSLLPDSTCALIGPFHAQLRIILSG